MWSAGAMLESLGLNGLATSRSGCRIAAGDLQLAELIRSLVSLTNATQLGIAY